MSTGHPLEDETLEGPQGRPMGRRQLLKALVAAGGAVAVSTLLPSRWIKPAVEVGVLPAHAQVSVTDTPTPTNTPTWVLCYTPTPSRTPTPNPGTARSPSQPVPPLQSSPDRTPQPSPSSTPEARRSLLERLIAEGRFPQDIARDL
jgi:hypothetical protein